MAKALAQALLRRGFQVLDSAQVEQADWVLAVCSATRAGGLWGGIPSQEVLLRYTLLDPREQTPVRNGVDAGAYADPAEQVARMGALREAAGNLAGKLSRIVATLPPSSPKPSPSEAGPQLEAPPTAPAVALAALPLHNATGRSELGGWCQSLASIAAQEFQKAKKYRIIERTRFAEVLKEEDLAAVARGDAQAVRRVGGELSADLLLVGEVALRPNGDLVVSARLVRVADKESLQVVYVTAPAKGVNELERDFRRQLATPTEDWITRQIDQLRQAPVVWPEASPKH